MAPRYICTFCGRRSDNLNDKNGCQHSPFKVHEYTQNIEGKTLFTCAFCRAQSGSPWYGGNCSQSPYKIHKWM